MTIRNIIVTTSIYPPTKALYKFASLKGWHLVVVGDLKTPKVYKLPGATYLSPADQEKIDPKLSELIGWNCIQRRNLGFIWAVRQGAELVATVDDDNIPYDDWGQNTLVDREVELDCYESATPAFDPIGATEHGHLWHRGFPIQWLSDRDYSKKSRVRLKADVEAGFWNGDPDIDAMCRMEYRPKIRFSDGPFPFTSKAIAPFNSQNTILSAKAVPEYFLFPGIGRMDDIWAAFWLQSKGFHVAFSKASVLQERNEHDLTRDFEAEILGYTKSHRLVWALADDPNAIWQFLPDGSRIVYDAYRRHFA